MRHRRIGVLTMLLLATGAPSARAAATFVGPAFHPAGGASPQEGVALGDLDGDGDRDLAVVTRDGGLHVVFNQGNGTFLPTVTHPGFFPDSAYDVALGDVDRDGDLDVVAAFFQFTGALGIARNQGNGAFDPPDVYLTCYSTQAVALGDLDGDWRTDTASASNCFQASILLNRGDGTFEDHGEYGAGYTPSGIDVGDLDGDGDRDVVYTNGTSTLTVLMNDGTGTFGPHTWYQAHDLPEDVAAVDLDGDGDLDLASAQFHSDDVGIHRNDGTGVFAAAVTYTAGDGPEGLAAADLDLDGDVDLAVANRTAGTVAFLDNAGNATFPARTTKTAGAGAEAIAAGDLDGDARPDVVVTHYAAASVAVYLNRTPASPDGDDDGVTNASDCAPADRSAWALPAAVADLLLDGSGSTRASWTAPARPGAARPRYDLLRSQTPSGFASATCVEAAGTDLVAVDPAIPAAAFYYLVRVRNACGVTLGADSNGTPRTGPSCP